MPYPPIVKPTTWAVAPNLRDYEASDPGLLGAARARAGRAARRPGLEHRPRGGRPARRRTAPDHLALRWLGKSGEIA